MFDNYHRQGTELELFDSGKRVFKSVYLFLGLFHTLLFHRTLGKVRRN